MHMLDVFVLGESALSWWNQHVGRFTSPCWLVKYAFSSFVHNVHPPTHHLLWVFSSFPMASMILLTISHGFSHVFPTFLRRCGPRPVPRPGAGPPPPWARSPPWDAPGAPPGDCDCMVIFIVPLMVFNQQQRLNGDLWWFMDINGDYWWLVVIKDRDNMVIIPCWWRVWFHQTPWCIKHPQTPIYWWSHILLVLWSSPAWPKKAEGSTAPPAVGAGGRWPGSMQRTAHSPGKPESARRISPTKMQL